MALAELLADLRADPQFMANVMTWRTLSARSARLAPIPQRLHPALQHTLHQRGIEQLYLHQAQAVAAALDGASIAVVTPTASGKTLCYNLPVLHTLLSDPAARALYLFPTKALAQDQLDEIGDWVSGIVAGAPNPQYPIPNTPFATYDGDTPAAQRSTIRKQSRLILSNPDMLHVGILPYHSQWADFLAGLRFVVIDEMHTYRGVFGSQVANVLRRLQRLCRVYGSQPQFICTSATIANPQQLAEGLTEQPITLIQENGAPSGEKHVILYNPPIYDAERGLRRSSVLEAQELAARSVLAGVQTLLFGRSRLTTEVLLTYVRERVARGGLRQAQPTEGQGAGGAVENLESAETASSKEQAKDLDEANPKSKIQNLKSSIRGYRGGYLPAERRAIEAGLRSGEVRAVVATNALELGIDIGQLQAAILCGYPGSIASAWQQMGRAGRTQESALALLVATGGVLDQYVIQHPEFLFTRSPEHALINPDNLLLLVDQVRCAAFELPFAEGETLGASPFTADVLQLLVEQGDLQRHGPRYFWSGDGYPAQQVSLRSAGSASVAIQARGAGESAQVIGQIDPASAPLLVHEGAIYLHEGQSYQVERLDLAQNLAQVTPATVDYYTQVSSETTIEVLEEKEVRASTGSARGGVGGEGRASTGLARGNAGLSGHPGMRDTESRVPETDAPQMRHREYDEIDFNANPQSPISNPQSTGGKVAWGELQVSAEVKSYRRVKHFTHENLGVYPLDYPPQVLETSGYWISVLPETQIALAQAGQWYDSPNDYGPNWQEQRTRTRVRDGYRCSQCGAPEPAERQHDVHHRIPFRTFGYLAGVNENYQLANRLDNLMLVCRTCHQRLEGGVRTYTGLDGLAYALANLAPLHLMCDSQDLGVSVVREVVAVGAPKGHPRVASGEWRVASGEWRSVGDIGCSHDLLGNSDVEFHTDLPLRDDKRGAILNPPLAPRPSPPVPRYTPTIYLYERIAAGLGFAARLYELHEELLQAAEELIAGCGCPQGCPACVGPVLEGATVQLPTKALALALARALRQV